MLFSEALIRVVVKFLRSKRIPLIVDPVMVATSGSRLLQPKAVETLKNELLPLACLATPNVPEAEVLIGRSIRTPEDLRRAARQIYEEFGCAALVKGGHLRGLKVAVDIFYDGTNELLLKAPFIRGLHTHGTGCTYSAAIAAYVALGLSLPEAVKRGKEFVTWAISGHHRVNGHAVLGWNQKPQKKN
jgi:hydroxymethylpyrimidine/phosphomethylpyrimidine kinase